MKEALEEVQIIYKLSRGKRGECSKPKEEGVFFVKFCILQFSDNEFFGGFDFGHFRPVSPEILISSTCDLILSFWHVQYNYLRHACNIICMWRINFGILVGPK